MKVSRSSASSNNWFQVGCHPRKPLKVSRSSASSSNWFLVRGHPRKQPQDLFDKRVYTSLVFATVSEWRALYLLVSDKHISSLVYSLTLSVLWGAKDNCTWSLPTITGVDKLQNNARESSYMPATILITHSGDRVDMVRIRHNITIPGWHFIGSIIQSITWFTQTLVHGNALQTYVIQCLHFGLFSGRTWRLYPGFRCGDVSNLVSRIGIFYYRKDDVRY
jgi:hypothetical protein